MYLCGDWSKPEHKRLKWGLRESDGLLPILLLLPAKKIIKLS